MVAYKKKVDNYRNNKTIIQEVFVLTVFNHIHLQFLTCDLTGSCGNCTFKATTVNYVGCFREIFNAFFSTYCTSVLE